VSPAHAIAWLETAAILLVVPFVTVPLLSGPGRVRAAAAVAAGAMSRRVVLAGLRAATARAAAIVLIGALALAGLSLAGRGPALPALAALQVMLVFVALGVIALALFFSAIFADPLDAAACTYAVVALLAGAFLLAGPFIARSPDASGIIKTVLIVNPLAGVASALDADPLRGEVLYQLSPIGQRRFEYPAPWMVGSAYAAAAIAFAAGASWRTRSCVACAR
jgi:hypothetical protein